MNLNRKIFFIRHCRPDFGLHERYCLGHTDMPLGRLGRMQGTLLGEELHFNKVYSSPLSRAVQTAQFIADEIEIIPDFIEASSGEWDGLSFEEIKLRWPQLYGARGEDRNLPIPGAECNSDAWERFDKALRNLLSKAEGDIAVVAHSTVLWQTTDGLLDYGCYYIDGRKFKPHPEMTPKLARKLLSVSGLPQKTIDHCNEVAQNALELADGLPLDKNLIECAALLHDIAKGYDYHEKTGGEWLSYLGYPEIGEIIAGHKDPGCRQVNEKSVVFLADKLPIEQRFEHGLAKCTTPEAIEYWKYRKALATELYEKIQNLK